MLKIATKLLKSNLYDCNIYGQSVATLCLFSSLHFILTEVKTVVISSLFVRTITLIWMLNYVDAGRRVQLKSGKSMMKTQRASPFNIFQFDSSILLNTLCFPLHLVLFGYIKTYVLCAVMVCSFF
jgi:hypothetical protein